MLRRSPRLAEIPEYVPGLTMAEVMREYGLRSVIKLASNESPYPPLPEVGAVIAAGAARLNRYPDGAGRELGAVLAARHGVDPDQVVLGNGSCELILLAGQALLDPGTSVIYPYPSFGLYSHLAAAAGARDVPVALADDGAVDLDSMAAMVDETTRLVVICNPNNPTGAMRDPEAVEAFIDLLPDDLAILIDEAYFDFVDRPDAGRIMSLVRRRENLLVLRTFSKAHGLCGLRVGYGIGGREWIAALDQVRQPFNTSSLAQAAALASLGNPAALAARMAETVAERGRMAAALDELGVAFTPSRANFMLLRAARSGAWSDSLHQRLLRRGVIVRDGGALGCPGTVRVSIGTPQENDAFIAALAAELDGPGASQALNEATEDRATP